MTFVDNIAQSERARGMRPPLRNLVLFVERARNRRIVYLLTVLFFAILIFVPRPYVARAKIVPQDTATSAGTSSLAPMLGGQTTNFASLLTGGRPSNDLYLIIGRSDSVTDRAIESLKLVGPRAPYSSMDQARRALAKKVDVHLLLGGVMEIETEATRPEDAQLLTDAYVKSISKQLASFGRQLIENKKTIVGRRFQEADARLARAEAALNTFRRANKLADPETELTSGITQRAALEAQLQAKLVELRQMEQVRGPESAELISLRSAVTALQRQVAQTAQPQMGAANPNLAGLSILQTQYLNLYRDYRFAQALYDVYSRAFEQVAVEQLAAESASYVQVIDEAHVDAKRHYNIWAIAALLATVLLALFTEWYAPATGLLFRRESEYV